MQYGTLIISKIYKTKCSSQIIWHTESSLVHICRNIDNFVMQSIFYYNSFWVIDITKLYYRLVNQAQNVNKYLAQFFQICDVSSLIYCKRIPLLYLFFGRELSGARAAKRKQRRERKDISPRERSTYPRYLDYLLMDHLQLSFGVGKM